MNNITLKKLNALKNVFNSYEIYKGGYKSSLESEINKLQNKISEEDYNNIVQAFKSYKNYIFNILANTRRVFIKLSEEEQRQQDLNFEDLDKLFLPLEDIE